jgi:hypothetical protein
MSGLVAIAAVLGSAIPASAAPASAAPAVASAPATLAAMAARQHAAAASTIVTSSSGDAGSKISCASPVACLAVGANLDDKSGNSTPAAEALEGTAWKAIAVKIPKGAASSSLDGVSCEAAAVLPGPR